MSKVQKRILKKLNSRSFTKVKKIKIPIIDLTQDSPELTPQERFFFEDRCTGLTGEITSPPFQVSAAETWWGEALTEHGLPPALALPPPVERNVFAPRTSDPGAMWQTTRRDARELERTREEFIAKRSLRLSSDGLWYESDSP